MRIPRRLHLPFGYVITIKQVSAKDNMLLDKDTGTYLDGSWDPETRTIAIKQTLPQRRKALVLYHECFHGLVDAQHHLMNKGIIQP